MKRLVLASAAVLLSTLTLGAQNGSSVPVVTIPGSMGSQKHPHNKQHNKQKPHHPHHHSSISARR
ncbi:MAG: hypothetical protein WA847_05650 [Terriglobales bacterium]